MPIFTVRKVNDVYIATSRLGKYYFEGNNKIELWEKMKEQKSYVYCRRRKGKWYVV